MKGRHRNPHPRGPHLHFAARAGEILNRVNPPYGQSLTHGVTEVVMETR
jgi:hypothetical protein